MLDVLYNDKIDTLTLNKLSVNKNVVEVTFLISLYGFICLISMTPDCNLKNDLMFTETMVS